MSRQNSNVGVPTQRKADLLVQQSKRRMDTLAIVSRKQVKLWKAMLLSVFFAGFVGALAFVVGSRNGHAFDEGTRTPCIREK